MLTFTEGVFGLTLTLTRRFWDYFDFFPAFFTDIRLASYHEMQITKHNITPLLLCSQ